MERKTTSNTFFSFFHLIIKVYVLSIILSVPDSVSTCLDLLQYVCFPVSNLMIELFIIHHTDSMFGHMSLLLSCGGYKRLGGELICITTLTMDKKKAVLMGIQRGLHSKGCIHIYTHVPFHVFLQILSCTSPLACSLAEKLFVLTETCTIQALFGSREPIPSHISTQFDRKEKGIRPAKV